MHARRYQRGQTVAFIIRIADGIEKRRLGEIVDLGARGVEVQFEDSRQRMWLRAAQVRPVEDESPVEVVEMPAPKLAVVPPPAVVAAPLTTPSIDALEAGGVDPIAAWLSLGRELVGRAAQQVATAEADVQRADGDVATAREMLATAEREATAARDRLRVAVAQRAEIERRTGGSV